MVLLHARGRSESLQVTMDAPIELSDAQKNAGQDCE
jgi:hypothetical protein